MWASYVNSTTTGLHLVFATSHVLLNQIKFITNQGRILLVGAGANIEDLSSLIVHWSSGSLGEGYGERAVPPTQKPSPEIFFYFWSSKSLVFMRFSAIFVSSSTTDGLLRNDLSGGGPYWWGARGHGPLPSLHPLNPALLPIPISTA